MAIAAISASCSQSAQPNDSPGRDRRRSHPSVPPGPGQRGHPRAAVGLDPDHHLRGLGVLTQLLPGQLVQPGHPRHALGQPGLRQPPARGVHQLHVVMVITSVVSWLAAQENPLDLGHSTPRFELFLDTLLRGLPAREPGAEREQGGT